MTQNINRLTMLKIREQIEKLLSDNKQAEITGEFEYNPEVVKALCDTAFYTNRIPKTDYNSYLKILEQVKIYRNLQKNNQNTRKSMNDYIENLVFWN